MHEGIGKRFGRVLFNSRWFWLVGVVSLFVLNFVILLNVQRAVQETQVAETKLKDKAHKIDIMWQEVRKKMKDNDEVEEGLKKRQEALEERERQNLDCKKEESRGKAVDQVPAELPVEPPLVPDASKVIGGGKGEVPEIANISAYLEMIKDPEERARMASEWMMKRIEKIQNPDDCENAKYHYCPVVNSCGGGCVIHQLAYCMLVGFANNRVTVIADGFRYLKDCKESNSPWDCVFQKMTHCPTQSIGGGVTWTEEAEKAGEKVTRVDLFSRSSYSRNYYPWAASDGFHTNTPFWLPPEIAPYLKKTHGDPRVWVVGHLEQYMLRYNNRTMDQLMDINKELVRKFQHPIVGIHVRRTDHRVEAPFRALGEYVTHARQYFDSIGVKEPRYAYLATDEPEVIAEAEQDFKDFTWIYYNNNGKVSGAVMSYDLQNDRTSMKGTYSLLSDWYFLQRVDFLVGTSSSQVTRMSYELMQKYHVDSSKLFVSLDDPWYFP